MRLSGQSLGRRKDGIIQISEKKKKKTDLIKKITKKGKVPNQQF